MAQYSHSRVECFKSCAYRYKLRYGDKLKVIPADNADNALYLGTAIHTGIEKGTQAGVQEYLNCFPVLTDEQVNETIKLEYLIPKARAAIPKGKHEFELKDPDFIGFIDLITPNEDGTYDIYDFKYSNNVKNYMESDQLHLYKFFYEKQTGHKVRNLYYLFIPKVSIKQKKTEDLQTFRKRIMEELGPLEIKLVQINYDPTKIIEFYSGVKAVLEATEFKKEPNYLCNWCDYQDYCQKGLEYMNLPNIERRTIGETKRRKMWIYGPAFSGKTTMLDDAPNPLNLNTDGNINFVTMPFYAIKDEVTVEGRQTKRKFAWEVFKDIIAELEKKQNDFQTIIIDLVEDTREMCRIYMYDSLGIQHESDSGFGKGWDIIKTEYLSTIRRFFNLNYENLIVISHEDVSKDITKKSGDKITRVAPNIQDAVANKIAGMVDIVARVVVEDDDSRTLNFKSNEVIFGGGRLKGIKETKIPLSWKALMNVYDQANSEAGIAPSENTATSGRKNTRARNSTPTEEKPQETAPSDVAEQDIYLLHQEANIYWKIAKGEKLHQADIDISVVISKEEYEAGIAKQTETPRVEGEVVEELPKEAPTRRTRTAEPPQEVQEAQEAPTRSTRTRRAEEPQQEAAATAEPAQTTRTRKVRG